MTDLSIYYYLGVINRDGMYTYGERAATPELAKVAYGNLQRRPADRLGIYRVQALPGYWKDSAGKSHQRFDKAVLVEAEPSPGVWDIG